MENFFFCAIEFASLIEKHPIFSMYHIKPEASLGPSQNIYKGNFLRKSQLLLRASVQNVLKIILKIPGEISFSVHKVSHRRFFSYF